MSAVQRDLAIPTIQRRPDMAHAAQAITEHMRAQGNEIASRNAERVDAEVRHAAIVQEFAQMGLDTMSTVEIRHRYTNDVLFSGEYDSLRGAVVAAVAAGANLARANLARANLARAYLAGANLADAYLADANLADANLAGANLAGANLAGAYLADAYLADAYLAGANLADAYLAGANLAGAEWRDGIVLTRRPLQIYGLAWPVTILDEHMQIGCELHTLAEWSAFDNYRIARMDGRAARKFWDAHGAALLALAASDGRGTAKVETSEAAE